MKRRSDLSLAVVGFLLATAGLVASCGGGDSSPSGPTQPPRPPDVNLSVTVYTDSGYSGSSITFTSDQSNLSFVSGPCSPGSVPNWNDCISAIRLGSGTGVTVYTDSGYSGSSITFTSDQSNLSFVSGPCSPGSVPNWNDCISAIRLFRR